MTEINQNATEILKKIVTKRNWYQGRFSSQLASQHKKSIQAGTIKYNTAVTILEMLGYELLKPEKWRKKTKIKLLKEAALRSGEENIARAMDRINILYPENKKTTEKKLHFGKEGKWW